MKPYYQDESCTIYHGDCREILPELHGGGMADAVVTDPPYGDTSLAWDAPIAGWAPLIDVPQLWSFGSLRAWMREGAALTEAGWRYGQEVIWRKHNGSSFHADRFRRVHEFAVHWYRGQWRSLHLDPPVTMDATPRTVRRKRRPPHTGHIEASAYRSEDGGPRLMQSVIEVPSCHGYAQHPTQKPTGILRPLITYSVPVGGVVLDPFMGVGSTLVAAKETGRRAIGIEIDDRYCEIAVERLGQGVFDLGEAA